MAPTIRVSEHTYNRLGGIRDGFETPDEVINRLIQIYDSMGKKNTTTEESVKGPKPYYTQIRTIKTKKLRNLELEKAARRAVGKAMKWESNFTLDRTKLVFSNSNRMILCKYSSFSNENNGWFWGVSMKYWDNWTEEDHLALIMENPDREGYSFLYFNPEEAMYLLNECGKDKKGEKKINVRMSIGAGKYVCQEWKDYDIGANTKILDIPDHG